MKSVTYLFISMSCVAQIQAVEPEPPLSEEQALAIVREQRELKASRELERKQRILGIEAQSEAVIEKDSHKMILRRVGWQPIQPLVAAEGPSAADESDANFEEIIPEDYAHSMISIGATVYDDSFTEVTWREPGVAGAKPFTVWVNRNFKFISPLHHFDRAGVSYSYIGFTSSVDTDAYVTHPVTGERFLPYQLPDWMPNSADFPSEEASYIVLVQDSTTEIPELLYQQMDALLGHYMENEAGLIATYQRAEALRQAKQKLDESEPEKKKDIVINYWPISSNSDL